MESLFPIDKNIAKQTCRDCIHRQRWECGSMIISYCEITRSNRTQNGLKKIKASSPACDYYKKEIKTK